MKARARWNSGVRKGDGTKKKMWKEIAFFINCILAFFQINWSHLTLTLPLSLPLSLSFPATLLVAG